MTAKPLFPRWSNALLWAALAALAVIGAALVAAPMVWARTNAATGKGEGALQPVEFSHLLHVQDEGIDCRYCHRGVDTSRWAGVPAASTCMTCHRQILADSGVLEPVRAAALDESRPLAWERVNRLPDFVFFDHSVHVKKGVGCVTCHGRVDRMGTAIAAEAFTMEWCVSCHRDPVRHLRPPEEVTNMEWSTPGDAALAARLDVHPTTDCSGCHR